jgi:pimeloyl-ACP methyl ester carboxylesterase
VSTFVLVHGSWHGGWCWERIVPRLEAAGHRAVAVDLPGHGANALPVNEVSLERYVAHLGAVLAAEREPVVLVGHSMGGLTISATAERVPGHIAQLVYVTGYLLRDGQCIRDVAQDDTETRIAANRVMAPDGRSSTVRAEALVETFYHLCPPADAAAACARLVPQAFAVLTTPLHVTAANWGRLPRAYIRCLQDRAIGPKSQTAMLAATPCDPVIDMDTDHSPFYSAPDALTAHLLSLADTGGIAPRG